MIFNSFTIWDGLVVLKELIFNSFYIGEGVVVLKELNLIDFTLERCGCLDNTNF